MHEDPPLTSAPPNSPDMDVVVRLPPFPVDRFASEDDTLLKSVANLNTLYGSNLTYQINRSLEQYGIMKPNGLGDISLRYTEFALGSAASYAQSTMQFDIGSQKNSGYAAPLNSVSSSYEFRMSSFSSISGSMDLDDGIVSPRSDHFSPTSLFSPREVPFSTTEKQVHLFGTAAPPNSVDSSFTFERGPFRSEAQSSPMSQPIAVPDLFLQETYLDGLREGKRAIHLKGQYVAFNEKQD